MKRALGIGLFTMVSLTGGSALAAACGAVTVAPDGRSASVPGVGAVLMAGDTFSCNFVADGGVTKVEVPAGAYGVFRTDSRGFYFLENDDSFAYKIDANGDLQVTVINGDDDFHDFTLTRYHATGLVAADTVFDGDFTFDLTDTDDDGGAPELDFDSIDVLVAYTTMASVKSSLSQIAAGETAMVAHLGATSGLLTGSDQRLEGDNEIGVMGGIGSYMFGVKGRYNIGEGFSLLGGASLINQSYATASVSGPMAALALRYVEPGINSFRLFGEGGADIGGFNASFTREYADGTPDGVSVTTPTTANLGSVFIRGGVVTNPSEGQEVVLAASLRESFVGIGGFTETLGAGNIFPATVGAQSGRFTTIKGTVAWTTELATSLDLTATASVGYVMAHDPVTANVMFVGAASGGPTSSLIAEGGLRLGWSPTPSTSIDGFVQASTGTAIGTHAQIGAAARLRF